MREQVILKGENNKKIGNKKKNGGSDEKKSGGSNKKKCGGSDKKKNSYKKKSGGVNETLINMDIANYEGVIQNKLMSQENATNGDGFQSGFSSSVTGGTMYGGEDAADKKLREILKNLIYDKRDDIINMLKLKFLSFANKLLNKTTEEDVKNYINKLKDLFIDKNIEDEKTTTENGSMFKKSVIIMVMKKNSENPFNNIINKLNETIINNIDINNLSKSNIGLFNFIDFDFVITKSTKINGDFLSESRPLYILRIIIKYIKDDKNIYVEEIHTFINFYTGIYLIVDNNSRFPDKSSTTRIIQTENNKIPELNEIYYSSTSYIHNIHKLILYKNKSIETDDTISNNCAKIIYELLKKLSEKYNNKEVVDIEDIRKSQDPPSADELVTIFEEALKNTSIPIEYLQYLIENIDRIETIAPVAAATPAASEAEQAAPATAASAQVPVQGEAAAPEKNIIKLLINKVKECYDPCDTDNIYLNMSTNEFLKNIENYLIRIFNMENEEKYKSMLKDLIQEEEKKAAEEAEANKAANKAANRAVAAQAAAAQAVKYKAEAAAAAQAATTHATEAQAAADAEAAQAAAEAAATQAAAAQAAAAQAAEAQKVAQAASEAAAAEAAAAAGSQAEAASDKAARAAARAAAQAKADKAAAKAEADKAAEAQAAARAVADKAAEHDKRLNLENEEDDNDYIYTDEDEGEEDYDNYPNIVINSARPAGAAQTARPAGAAQAARPARPATAAAAL